MNEILKEESAKAIKQGNEFKGFLGVNPNDMSKEQLIMVCNVLYDNVQRTSRELYLLKKYELT